MTTLEQIEGTQVTDATEPSTTELPPTGVPDTAQLLKPLQREHILTLAREYAAAFAAHTKWTVPESREQNETLLATAQLREKALLKAVADVTSADLGANLEADAYRNQLEMVTAERNNLIREGNRRAGEVADLHQEKDRLTGELSTVRAQHSTVVVERDELRQIKEFLQTQRDRALSEIAGARAARNEVIVERDRLQQQLQDTVVERERHDSTVAELGTARRDLAFAQERLATAQRELIDAGAELERFKEKVHEVAYRYADRHGWCHVIDEAMDELGLPQRGPKKYEATLQVTVTFRGAPTDRQEHGTDWVESSLSQSAIRDAIRDAFELDSDHDSDHTEITEIEFSVTDVESVDN